MQQCRCTNSVKPAFVLKRRHHLFAVGRTVDKGNALDVACLGFLKESFEHFNDGSVRVGLVVCEVDDCVKGQCLPREKRNPLTISRAGSGRKAPVNNLTLG